MDDFECDSEGICTCKSETIGGNKCDQCQVGYYGFPNCEGLTCLMYYILWLNNCFKHRL